MLSVNFSLKSLVLCTCVWSCVLCASICCRSFLMLGEFCKALVGQQTSRMSPRRRRVWVSGYSPKSIGGLRCLMGTCDQIEEGGQTGCHQWRGLPTSKDHPIPCKVIQINQKTNQFRFMKMANLTTRGKHSTTKMSTNQSEWCIHQSKQLPRPPERYIH